MEENNNKVDAFHYLDELEYIVDASVFKGFGKSFIDSKRFKETLYVLRETMEDNLDRARKIENREELIIRAAEEKKAAIIQEFQEEMDKLNVIDEAKAMASDIVQDAHDRALEIVREATETKESLIENGHSVKSHLIEQGRDYIEQNLVKLIDNFESNRNMIVNNLNDQYQQLIENYQELSPNTNSPKQNYEEENEQIS